MNIAFAYKDWVKMHENDFDYSVTQRGMTGLRDIGDEEESIVFYYPAPFVEELKELPFGAATLTFALYRTDYSVSSNDHKESLDVRFDINETSVRLEVTFDHEANEIYLYAHVTPNKNPFPTIREYITFKQTIYQKIEAYMRENSPDRLTMVTNTYEYRGDIPFKEEGVSI